MRPESQLPNGFRVRIAPTVRTFAGGRILLGGSPLRVLQLNSEAASFLAGGHLTVHDAVTGRLARRLVDTNLAFPVLDDAGPPSLSDITVVIPCRDRPEQLTRLLAALRGMRVIVVDDASQQPEPVVQACQLHGARHLPLEANVGPAGARNAGLAQVTTPLVAFVDSDVVMSPEGLGHLARHFMDPAVGVVAPRIRPNVIHDPPSRLDRWELAASALDLGENPCLVVPWARVGWLPGACLVARTDAVRDTGFDASRRVAEDVDLVWRLTATGWRVRYDPAVEATHDTRGSFREWFTQRVFYGTGAAWLASRHGDRVAPAVLAPAQAVGVVAALFQRRWSLMLAAGCAAHSCREVWASIGPRPQRAALTLALLGEMSISCAGQTTDMVLRHWWPVTALACLVSSRARRATLAACLWTTVDRRRPRGSFLARRLDDLAYGTGLWLGALRDRQPRVLLPRIRK